MLSYALAPDTVTTPIYRTRTQVLDWLAQPRAAGRTGVQTQPASLRQGQPCVHCALVWHTAACKRWLRRPRGSPPRKRRRQRRGVLSPLRATALVACAVWSVDVGVGVSAFRKELGAHSPTITQRLLTAAHKTQQCNSSCSWARSWPLLFPPGAGCRPSQCTETSDTSPSSRDTARQSGRQSKSEPQPAPAHTCPGKAQC